MRYVAAKIMWRPANIPIEMNGAMARDAT